MAHSTRMIALPGMTPGTARQVTVHRFGRAGARPKAYLQAAVHANELPGAMALHHLMPMLAEADRRGRIRGEIVLVPAVNPIGLSQLVGNTHLGRYDFVGNDNFNRNWPDLAAEVAKRIGDPGRDAVASVARIRKAALAVLGAMRPSNELQALRVAILKLSIDADTVLDLHCDREAVLHLFVSAKDWPGPAQLLAADLGARAAVYNEPFPQMRTFAAVNSSLWPRLAAHFPRASIPQACFSGTVEVRGLHDVNHALGEEDARNLYRFLVRRGVIAGQAGKLPRLKTSGTPRGGVDVGYAPKPGILVYHAAKGARVREGQAVCEVIDLSDPRGPKARRQVLARTDGILFSRKPDGLLAWPGMVLFRVAGAKLLAHREGWTGQDD